MEMLQKDQKGMSEIKSALWAHQQTERNQPWSEPEDMSTEISKTKMQREKEWQKQNRLSKRYQ